MANKNAYPQPITLSNVKVVYKNFKGQVSSYNQRGSRHFSILLDNEMAEELASQGLNVKYPKPNPNIDPAEDKRLPTLEVAVSATSEVILPHVKLIMVDGDNVHRIPNDDFQQINMLDSLRIESADIVIQPSPWVLDQGLPSERSGIKAYVSIMYIKLDQSMNDPFADKYGVPATDDVLPPF